MDDELMSTFLIKAKTETNARMEIAEIAKEASISPRTATRRIEKMQQNHMMDFRRIHFTFTHRIADMSWNQASNSTTTD